MTVGEWVRRELRAARIQRSAAKPQSKLKSVRQAAEYSFPAPEIDQMLAEIARATKVDLRRAPAAQD